MKEKVTGSPHRVRVRMDVMERLVGPMDTYARQLAVARRLGISHSTLYRLINSSDHSPSAEVIAAIVGNLTDWVTFDDICEIVPLPTREDATAGAA